jgi:hypothetical protein
MRRRGAEKAPPLPPPDCRTKESGVGCGLGMGERRSAMRQPYDRWASDQLGRRKRCRVDASISCIPLRGDPICRACYDSDMEEGSDEA